MIDLQYISLESEPQSAASDDPGRDDKEFQQSKLARWSELKERLADYRADFIQTKVSDSDHSCHMAGTTEVDSCIKKNQIRVSTAIEGKEEVADTT